MTTEPTPDELLEDEARAIADEKPDPLPQTADLPANVRDGRIEEAPDEAIVEHKEI